MMEGFGFLKNKLTTEKPATYLKKKEIIIWKEDIRLLVTWFRVMWLPVQQKKDAMQVMV